MTTTSTTTRHTSEGSRINFIGEQVYDSKLMRHFLNGSATVLHCHHYAALCTKLALDATNSGGPELLADASAETFGQLLKKYLREHDIKTVSDRIAIAEQYFAFVGLGEIKFEGEADGGTVSITHSHVDEGWLKRWGQNDRPINYIGQGYIKGAWAAIFDRKPSTLNVEEVQSIVCGAPMSRFSINWN